MKIGIICDIRANLFALRAAGPSGALPRMLRTGRETPDAAGA